MLKIQSLREATRDELLLKQNDLLDELFNLNMRLSFKALDNPLRLRHIRRELARVKTVLREDKLGLRKLAEHKTSILLDSRETKIEKDK
ncbi:MAG: 50S ribosomal protein L29 [Candidatus Zixiibacteriota bacterium]